MRLVALMFMVLGLVVATLWLVLGERSPAVEAPSIDVVVADAAENGRQKLYVLSSAGNDITVVDVATNEIIGSIEVGDRPHGIAAPASQDVLHRHRVRRRTDRGGSGARRCREEVQRLR